MKLLIMSLSISMFTNSYAISLSSMIKNLTKESKNNESNLDKNTFLEIKNPPNGNHEIKDFNEAKRILKKTHYLGQTKTFYCQCDMTEWNKFDGKNNCSYKPKKYPNQWENIEAEHALPMSAMFEHTKEYKEGHPSCKGKTHRKCTDIVYGFIAGDLWIVANPSEMELNRVHSDLQWAELGNKGEQWGSCDFYYADRKVQPPQSVKGKIARTYKYVQDVYKINVISNKNQKLFDIWANYPPTKDQCNLAKEIIKVQKNRNEFEIEACQKANLW